MEDMEKADSGPIPTNDDASPSQGISCALCGCATPAVRCDRCNSQIFCLSCDDMYHRHPKRKLHLRKAVDSIWSSARSPRLRRHTDLPGDPSKIPIPPPRAKKRDRHAVGSRIFLKSGLELGSFGHSKVFDPKSLPTSKDFFTGQKSPASLVESNCDDASSPIKRSESAQIYENDNVAAENLNDRSPWNTLRPNISSPIQVSIPSSSPDIVPNGQSFGYPMKPHSQSAADLTGHSGPPIGHQPYHFHPPYPYMHPPMHPYSHSMAHLNCAQCISSSWSNLISPHPSPYFHPMPWGSAQNTMSRHPVPGQPGPMKHSHGDLPSFPESGFHYPYPGGGYYPNGPPMVDPNFIKDLHEQAEMQKSKKEIAESRSNPVNEEMDTTESAAPATTELAASTAAASTEAAASATQDVKEVDEVPVLPEKPTEPWTCVHCTYINPPGSYICEVCCKTSYGNKRTVDTEEQSEMRPLSRDSESPLINRDALMNSPAVSELRNAQKDDDVQIEIESKDQSIYSVTPDPVVKLTTETQTFTTTKTTDVQTQNISRKSIASSTDSIFPKQEISVQTEHGTVAQTVAVATDPMISSQSLESLLSGVSAPPYHNRRAGWGRGATSFSTQSLYDRGRSRSPMPRSHSFHTEAPNLGRDSSFASEEAMHSVSQTWLYTDPMYYKPRYQGLGQQTPKEDYFDGTWGSMDKLNRRIHKKDKGKVEHVRPKLHRSLDDLKSEKRAEPVPIPELMMLQTVKEAERLGYTLEDLHVAYLHCGRENPVYWLEDNWLQMVKNVIALAAKYGEDNEENDVGVITTSEAKEALRIHRGDIWDAVTECIENRQRKILELTVRGNFTQKQISEALKNNDGNVELAYADLLRQSTRRHKFILSPGLSTDSEDLNLYNPTEDSTVDRNLSISPVKAMKTDAAGESKTEKKKSDFFTKLTAIREAQSERRKAREEKELIRETITQDFPADSGSDALLKKELSIELTPSISREDSKEVEEPVLEKVPDNVIEVLEETKTDEDITDLNKGAIDGKEGAEDNIPVDFDTNWSESQGEWIEEYVDEHWEENDEHWVGLGKKFEKMEKEYEEEARQMAALWEKEELEDDVFEEDAKPQDEVTNNSDKKFDEWVKENLKVDSSEYEEEVEIKEKRFSGDIIDVSIRERLELEGSQPSPLQHYPTAFDLSVKSQFESDWVDLPADAEIEKLAHDIVCEGSDVENRIEDEDIVMYEEEKKVRKYSDLGSDEDWEKIDMDEQLHEINELDQLAFPEKESEIEKEAELHEGITEKDIMEPLEKVSQIMISKEETVLYKNLEDLSDTGDHNVEIIATDLLQETFDKVSADDIKQEISPVDEDQPKPPVRRRSKLNSWEIEKALKNHITSEDTPPALPEKMKHKDIQPTMSDIYAMPDKSAKTLQQENSNLEASEVKDTQVPQKPPRLNLSPLPKEAAISKNVGDEREPDLLPKMLSKDGSPALSYESDSNFFADSESDTEIKLHRQKNIQRKSNKYSNELQDNEMEFISKDEVTSEEKSDLFESNLDLELDDDIDPALIEPLPRMTDIDFDPELPILLGGRGRQLVNKEDVNAPKAFREDTTRPLQLFKATKRETPTNTMSTSSSVMMEHSTDFNKKISESIPEPTGQNQMTERYYYNETIVPQQSLGEIQLPEKQEIFDQPQPQKEYVSKAEVEQAIEQALQSTAPIQEEEVALDKAEVEQAIEQALQSTAPIQEEEVGFTEGMSAMADYFFGRYNEVVVAPPKKKGSVRSKPSTSTTDKSVVSSTSKDLSTSEIISAPKVGPPSQMEQSASAVLQEEPQPESAALPTSEIKNEISKQQKQQVSAASKDETPAAEKQKIVPPIEPLSFAEDYLFGAYNQVIVPRKKKNMPVVLAVIPKLGGSLSRTQSPHKEQKLPPAAVSTPEPPELPVGEQEEEEVEEEMEEEMPEDEENTIATDISAAYDDVFHDLPSEMLSNQSFDESSIYYESFQDAVEDIQESAPVPVSSSVVNVRPKSVHFEEAKAPVAPPRKNKLQGSQRAKEINAAVSSESYADEYLYQQYGALSWDKKKLPECSEDFRMNQGFESAEIPCDVPIMPDEQKEGIISSETSVNIPLKSPESFKCSSENEFGVCEQPLNSNIDRVVESKTVKTSDLKSQSTTQNIDDSLFDVTAGSEVTSYELMQDVKSTDLQSEKSESFEEISIPDMYEEVLTEPSVVSCNLIKESKLIPNVLSSSMTEPQISSAQISQSNNANTDESTMSSDRHEVDQFVFIEQTQDIINEESYHLYDLQESLIGDLSYINIKGNIEDECTDDSEQEWKRNEDRKNTLNASFLKTASDKKDSDEHLEMIMDKSEKFDLDDSKNSTCTDIESKIEELNSNILSASYDVVEEDHSKSLESSFYETEAIELVTESESVETDKISVEKASYETEVTEDETFEKVNKIIEKIDERLPVDSHIFENVEKVIEDTIENLPKIDQEFELEVSSAVDESQVISEKIFIGSSKTPPEEFIEKLPEIDQNTVSEDYFETEVTQILSDNVLIETVIGDSVCLVETNQNILQENLPESDGTLSTLDVISNESVEKLSGDIAESLTEINQDFTSTDFSSDSTSNEFLVISESAEDLSDESGVSRSEATHEALLPISSNPADAQYENTDINSPLFTSDDSTISEIDIEYSEDIDIGKSVDDLFTSEDEEVEMGEEAEASGELSDDNLSTHSSVSTQIAISLKTNVKESDGDECSLNLEQSENFEDGEVSEVPISSAASSEKLQNDEGQNFEFVTDDESLKKLDKIPGLSEYEEHVSEIVDLDFKEEIVSRKDKSELTPTPSFESEPQEDRSTLERELKELPTVISVSSTDNDENVSGDHVKKFSLDDESIDVSHQEDNVRTVFDSETKIIQNSVDEQISESLLESPNDTELVDKSIDIQSSFLSGDEYGYAKVKPSDLPMPDTLCSEVPAQINVDSTEVGESNDIITDEMDSECLMAEEPIMSRFYDEWYQNVESSTNFTYLSAESIYAKYGAAESSESGNESDVDNALSTVSCEDSTQDIQKESLSDVSSLNNQITGEEEVSAIEVLSVKKDAVSDVILCDSFGDSESLKNKETSEAEMSQNDISAEKEIKLEQDQFVSKPKDEELVVQQKTDNLLKALEETEIINDTKSNEFIQPTQEDSKIIDATQEKNKFSTSKSCQTEDSFEEDIFFDSFDDTFTIPSYLHIPIEQQIKPSTSDMSIQCELISIEEILSSKKISGSVPQIEVITPAAHAAVSVQDSSEEPKMKGEQPKESYLASEEKEESSCESFEDSDSDIFIESPSSQDELDVGVKRGFLHADVDSDTGFSSGSEYGWTKKSVLKQKEMKKGVKTLVTDIDSQQKSCPTENGSASSSKIYVEESICEDIQENIVKTSNISEESVDEKSVSDKSQECSESSSDEAIASPLPREIIERAITPIAIPQFPSLDENLVFVEIQENVEEAVDNTVEEVILTSAAVEYFYGPLPETVKIESPSNEGYFETASEFSEPLSFSLDRTESFSESISSLQTAEPVALDTSDFESEIVSQEKDFEDESFADPISSSKVDDESISEYFPFPETSISAACRMSIAESDVFDLAQSDITPDTGFVDVTTSLEFDNREAGKLTDEKSETSVSEISKDVNLVKAVNKVDKTAQEESFRISSSSNVCENKEIVISDVSGEIQSKTESHDKILQEKRSKVSSSEKTDIDNNLPEAISEICASDSIKEGTSEIEHFVDSRPELTSDKSDLSETTESEPALFDLAEPSSDLPPKPSDIVRYLYYDDSITFDEDSYVTQSENVGIPSLASEEVKSADSFYEEVVNESRIYVTTEVPNLLSDQPFTHEEKLTQETTDTSTNDATNIAKNIEVVHIVPEILEISESDKLKETQLDKDVKIVESVIESSSEQKTFLQSDLSKDIVSSCESDLKFPVVEVIAAENVTVLPGTTEQIYEPIIPIEELIPESVAIVNTPVEEKSTISEDSEFQDVPQKVFKQTSPDIPSAPSDIVRYLYYDDDITFDETTQSSFHSHSNNNASDLGSDDLQVQFPDFESFEVKIDVDTKLETLHKKETICLKHVPELQQGTSLELPQEAILDISTTSQEQSSHKIDSSSAKDESVPPVDTSEFIENWFDLEETDHKKKCHDSEQFSSTKSSALKDSEQACIPEYILSPKFDNGIPIGKTDIDEITDISTHFTMTDDSDKFSDIESDISLNLEEESMLPIEFSDPMKIEFKEVEFVDDEMGVCTPKVKNIEGGFRFVTSDTSKEKIIEPAVLEESQEQKYFDGSSVTASDLAIQHPMEFLESPGQNSNELDIQKVGEELNEKFDECISSTDFSEMSKEHFVECPVVDEDQSFKDISQDLAEAFDECVTSTDFSEPPNKQLGESSTSNELCDNSPIQDIEQSLSEEKFDECIVLADSSKIHKANLSESLIPSELVGLESSRNVGPDQKNENFDECITSADFSEISKDQFIECVTSDDLTHTESSKDIVLEYLEASDKHVSKEDSELIKEQSEKLPTTAKADVYISAPESFVSDENGNYPYLVAKEDFTECSKESITSIVSEKLDVNLKVDILEASSADKNEEDNISCHKLSEIPAFAKQSITNVEAELEKNSNEKLEVSSLMTEITTVDQNDDLEISCYTAPNEDSHSISTDVTENWSDAESKNIEIDESVYDLPQDYINNTFIESDFSENQKLHETLVDQSQLFTSEKSIIKSAETDIPLTESQKEIEKTDEGLDSNNKINACTSAESSQQDSTVSPFSFKNMPSDISEVKMETQSEISSAMKKIDIECMSTVSGAEPIFSSSGTMYDTQEVQPEEISTGDICQEKGVTTANARREISCYSTITSCVDTEVIASTGEVGISETLESDIFQAVDFKFSDIRSETESQSLKIAKNGETKSEEIPLTIDSKEIICETLQESEFISTIKTDDITKRDEICKEIEIVDFSGKVVHENIHDTKFSDAVTVLPDLTSSRKELVDFKMGNIESIDSGIEKQTISKNEDLEEKLIVKNEKCDIGSNEVSLKGDDFVDSETAKQVLSKTLEHHETVDFKGSLLIDKDTSICQIQEPSKKISEKDESKQVEQRVVVCSSDTSILPEVMNFKGKTVLDDSPITKGKDISYAVKTCDDLSFNVTDTFIKKGQEIDEEKSCISKESTLKLNEKCSFEVVDFKGQLTLSSEIKIDKDIQEMKETTDNSMKTFETADKEKEVFIEKTKKSDEIPKTSQNEDFSNFAKESGFVQSSEDSLFETVDFKGQLTAEFSFFEKPKDISSALPQKEAQFVEKSETYVEKQEDKKISKSEEVCTRRAVENSLNAVEKSIDFNKIESNASFETVDFSGEPICSFELKDDTLATIEEMIPKLLVDSKSEKVNVSSQITDSTESPTNRKKDFTETISRTESETVDFKGMIVADRTTPQLKESDIPDVKIKSTMKKMTEDENIESCRLRKTVDFDRCIDSKDKKSVDDEVVSSTDFGIYQDRVFEEVAYETDMVATYSDYISIAEPAYDLRDTYGYATAEQVAPYESGEYMSEEYAYYDEMSVESAGYSISAEETNELFSCVETLSTDEDTSLQFNSVSDGLEDSLLLITSEEFTDVPSHLTSTEGSDKWSDVEGDIFLEDTELDRDKTPIRTLVETSIFTEETNDTAMKREEITLKASEIIKSAYKSTNEEDIVKITENNIQDLSNLSKKENEIDFTTEIHELKTVQNLEVLKETEVKTSHEENKASKNVESVEAKSLALEESKDTACETKNVFEKIIESEVAEKLSLSSKEEISSINDKVSLEIARDIQLSTEKLPDTSVSVSEGYTDVTSHYLSAEESVKCSDVENVTEFVGKESYESILTETKQINEVILENEKIDQVVFDKTMKLPEDIQAEESDIDTTGSLTEHYADVKSLKDQTSTVDTFSSQDAETAISKTHEDTSTDISSQFEKTDSEPWLEAETEPSVSEVGEDIAFCIEKDGDTKVVFVDYEKAGDEVETVQSSETPYASTTSSSYSDQASDTYADISLQGATTENSDKWSDIESEGLIDEVLYGNVDIAETADMTDLPLLSKITEENKNINEIFPPIENLQSSSETTTENIALSVAEGKNKEEDFSISTVSKSNLLETESFSSFENPDSLSTNLTDSKLTSIQTEYSLLSLTSSAAITVGMSDDELTSVTPLDITTTEDSDKWSDISGDTSQIDEESSVSLKANLKLREKELDSVSSKFKTDLSSKVKQSENTEESPETVKADDSVKKVDGDSSVFVKASSSIQESAAVVSSDSKADKNEKDQSRTVGEDTEKIKLVLAVPKEDSSTTVNIDQHPLEFHQQHTIDSKLSKKTADDEVPQSTDVITDESSRSLETLTIQLEIDDSKVSADEMSSLSFRGDFKSQDEALDVSVNKFKLKKTEEESDSIVTESIKNRFESHDQIEMDSITVQERMKSKMLESIKSQSVEEKTENSSSSNITTEESGTVDNFTDVPTYTSETSEAYCELDSDHSFEDTESPLLVDSKDQDIYDVTEMNYQQTGEVTDQSFSEYYENSADEMSSLSFRGDFKSQDEALDVSVNKFKLKKTEEESDSIVTESIKNRFESHDQIEMDSITVQERMKSKMLESIKSQSVEEKTENSSSSNITTEESGTVDNFIDVPTYTSETSEAYCELDSDHSFEDTESPLLVDSKDQDIYDVTEMNYEQTAEVTGQSFSEYYENSLVNDEHLENIDDYALDAIPENEFENFEEEYSLSEHFEINEDELIYPLPYNDDWIEQSFELKEYGVEAVFSESGSDIHGLGIGSEEYYDDEDIQRAIDYNLSTFEENETNIENVGASESFKTLSNDASPHLKPEEYDTWSTADAPSIVEELDEHDNILSKIDEILAEDFDVLDSYQPSPPLNLEEEIESDMLRNVSTPEEISDKKSSEKDDSSFLKSSLLERDTSNEKVESEGGILKKDSILRVESDILLDNTVVVDSKEIHKAQSESTAVEISPEKDSKYTFRKGTDAVSGKIALKNDKNEEQIESQSCEFVLKRDSITDVESNILSDSTTVHIDSKEVEKIPSESVSIETSIRKQSKPVFEDDSKIALKKDTTEKLLSDSNTMSEGKAIKEKITAVSEIKTESLQDKTSVKESSSSIKSTDSEVIGRKTVSKQSSLDNLKTEVDSVAKEATATEISIKATRKESGTVSREMTASQEIKVKSVSKSKEVTAEKEQTEIIKNIHENTNETIIKTDSGGQIPKTNLDPCIKKYVTESPEIVQETPLKLQVPAPDESPDSVSLSVTKTESSLNIPCKEMPESTEISKNFSIEEKSKIKSSESSDNTQLSCHLSESSKYSATVSVESVEVQSNIPDQKVCKDETFIESKPVSDSSEIEVKPDIPKKTRSRTLDSKEGASTKDESNKKPSLPPKKTKRNSVSDSSSSVSESLSSSSSVESLGSFESAVSGKSSKSSLKSSDETSMHSASPEVPARRSRSSKMSSSSSRSTSRDSDDSGSVPSRSSSLKIRRRSSNFIEPEPIDLSKKRASIDERMRKLQNEGKCTSKEKAFIAAKLIEMQFEEEDALLASRQCNTVYNAVKFLTQLCEMCNCRFPINMMSSMVQCAHRACKECLKAHFTSLIYDRSVFTLLCPICQNSDITDQNIQEYFSHLDMNLRNILEDKVYDLFQRKLRDEVLTKDPNFHWCSQCSSGFIASPRLKKLYCPDCSAITCALCHQTWELEHEGVHCERFQQWKDMHTPEPPPAGLVKFLVDRGISCPSCGLVYAQACGGCLMYKCSHCSFEFCGFCTRPLKKLRECANDICDSRGLHIHHLQNCLFFLRDKDITEIQMLLEEESITYLTIPPKDQIVKRRCQVREQKNNHGVLVEDRCGRDIEPYCGGLCRTHYYEYLAELLRKNNISPLSIMTIQDLQFMLRKSRVLVPEKVKGETSEEYYERILNVVTSTLT